MRRVVLRVLSAASVACAAIVFAGAWTAWAQAPSAVAWWSKLAVAPPNVPSGGLYVAGDPSHVLDAISTVRAVHVDGDEPVTLTLQIASGSIPPPGSLAVVACAITSPWSVPAGGHGDLAAAPRYDCTGASKGVVATDNRSVSWYLPAIDVALVPDSTAPPVPFTVAFAPPGDDAVQLTTGAPARAADVVRPAPQVDDEAAPVATGNGVIARPTAPAATPHEPAAASAVPAAQITSAAAPTTQAVPIALDRPDEGAGQRLVAGLALLGLAAGWWFMSNRPLREPRLLVQRP